MHTNDNNRSQGSQNNMNATGQNQNQNDQRSSSGNQQQGQRSSNAGNFANDPERAREAGRKGGLA
jgi:general stress protein YciG